MARVSIPVDSSIDPDSGEIDESSTLITEVIVSLALILIVSPSVFDLIVEASRGLSAEIQVVLLKGGFDPPLVELLDLELPVHSLIRRQTRSLEPRRVRTSRARSTEPMQRIRGDVNRFSLHRRRHG